MKLKWLTLGLTTLPLTALSAISCGTSNANKYSELKPITDFKVYEQYTSISTDPMESSFLSSDLSSIFTAVANSLNKTVLSVDMNSYQLINMNDYPNTKKNYWWHFSNKKLSNEHVYNDSQNKFLKIGFNFSFKLSRSDQETRTNPPDWRTMKQSVYEQKVKQYLKQLDYAIGAFKHSFPNLNIVFLSRMDYSTPTRSGEEPFPIIYSSSIFGKNIPNIGIDGLFANKIFLRHGLEKLFNQVYGTEFLATKNIEV